MSPLERKIDWLYPKSTQDDNQTYIFLYKFLMNFSNTKYILKKYILDMKMCYAYIYFCISQMYLQRDYTTHTPLYEKICIFKFYILS